MQADAYFLAGSMSRRSDAGLIGECGRHEGVHRSLLVNTLLRPSDAGAAEQPSEKPHD